jgi:hypothetical protein
MAAAEAPRKRGIKVGVAVRIRGRGDSHIWTGQTARDIIFAVLF